MFEIKSESSGVLAEDTFLADDLLRQLMSVGEVDLLVGISSHDAQHDPAPPASRHSKTVIQQHFVRQRVVIVLMDGGDKDEEDNVVSVETAAPVPREKGAAAWDHFAAHDSSRDGELFAAPPTPGSALRTILAVADFCARRACAVVSPASTNLTADSIANLLTPGISGKI